MDSSILQEKLLHGLTARQKDVVTSNARRLLTIAGAGSGKTEVIARRVAWLVGIENVPKDSILAFTFTERAAEEMKFRIRQYIQLITPDDESPTLGGMYIGTIHGFCLKLLKELRPDIYHNYEILDDLSRVALVKRGYYNVLALGNLEKVWGKGQYEVIELFLQGYDFLNEYDLFDVKIEGIPPYALDQELTWCKKAILKTSVGQEEIARAFAVSAARYYAYLKCRRFLDFSTSQSELVRLLRNSQVDLDIVHEKIKHVIVDEVQDLNPVQDSLVRIIVGDMGSYTAVGDHRQAIFAWRGGKVDIMAQIYEELKSSQDGQVVELEYNFRSTERIVKMANEWASTIGPVRSMGYPEMVHSNEKRVDYSRTHVNVSVFSDRQNEAQWIAKQISQMVKNDGTGALHTSKDGTRGLSYGDIIVLLRSSTDARTYMQALEEQGIPTVFRAGPDLFSQPEVLLFIALLANMVGMTEFYGSDKFPKSLPSRIRQCLDCDPVPSKVIAKACEQLRTLGLPIDIDAEYRLTGATHLLCRRHNGDDVSNDPLIPLLQSDELKMRLQQNNKVRRIFPQTLFHLLLSEAGVAKWENIEPRGKTAMFHLGQLSSMIKGIDTPGWLSVKDFKDQIIALCMWGAQNGRVEEAPLLVQPDAVTIGTIHSAKGLEYAAVFLADVNANRFPSRNARAKVEFPFDGPILEYLDPNEIADNGNYDNERRLMYVAITRAERYLNISCSGNRKSVFCKQIEKIVQKVGGTIFDKPSKPVFDLKYEKTQYRRDVRLVTSFSDLRYYLECPHDFYLRKVLGFAPTINQAFGYGRGIHNLLREIHTEPEIWAKLANAPEEIKKALKELINSGLFYLRYTTGKPADNMRKKAIEIIAEYVQTYSAELSKLRFEPEREFETLLEEEQVLISGAIDVIRLDDPPRVTLIDFKSGHSEAENVSSLDEQEMRLQILLYALAAKGELEYEPERGLVRYLGESDLDRRELKIEMDPHALEEARNLIISTAKAIKDRKFNLGPDPEKQGDDSKRCSTCDWLWFCGMEEAKDCRKINRRSVIRE